MKTPPLQLRNGALAATFCGALITGAAMAADNPASADNPQVKRGAHLVAVSGCHDCHTPFKMGKNGPEPDMTQMLSGHPQGMVMPPPPKLDGAWMWAGSATNTAFAGPWGISYAVNLTTDADTGIGKWKADEFVKAIKTGKHIGVSRPIMPPMPWQAYSHYADADLRAIFAYLKTVPAIKNKVPDYAPPAAPPASPAGKPAAPK